jgi:hypothetical protein
MIIESAGEFKPFSLKQSNRGKVVDTMQLTIIKTVCQLWVKVSSHGHREGISDCGLRISKSSAILTT